MSKTLFLVLASALLVIGFSPMSNHMLSMPGMKMDAISASNQSNTAQESADDHSTSSCCDAITPCSIGIDFLVPQPTNITLSGDSKRVISSAPTVRFICINTLRPPPKA